MANLKSADLKDLGSFDVVLNPSELARVPPLRLDLGEMEPEPRAWAESLYSRASVLLQRVTSHRFARALVAGQGTVVTEAGAIVFESAREFLEPGNVPDGFERGTDSGGFMLKATGEVAIDAPCVLAKRPWAQNFGHFIVDAATVACLMDRLGVPKDTHLIVTRFDNPVLRAVALEVLGLLAPGVPILEHPDHEVWRVRQLHYVSPTHIPTDMKRPEPLAVLRSALLLGRAPAERRKRLFVGRGATGYRGLVNESAIIDACRARGFEVVRPETLTMREQASLFNQAEIVVGTKGAALTNLLFGTAGSYAIVLSPSDFPDPFFWDICNHAGVHYLELAGRRTTDLPRGQNLFAIDEAKFRKMLDLVEARLHRPAWDVGR